MSYSHSDAEEERTASGSTTMAPSSSSFQMEPSQMDTLVASAVQRAIHSMQIELKQQQQQFQQQQQQQQQPKKTGEESGRPDASFYKNDIVWVPDWLREIFTQSLSFQGYVQVKEMAKLFQDMSECHLNNPNNVNDQDIAVSLWKIEDIMSCPSFHGVMSRREAEIILDKNGTKNCYLTRYDETKKSCCLTVKLRGKKFKNFVIDIIGGQTEPAQFQLKGAGKVFDKMSDLLHFYENTPVDFEVYQIGDAVQSEEYAPSKSKAVQKKGERSAFGFPTWKVKHIMLSPSFHREMLGEDAELMLEEHHSPICYLTRYDATADKFYLSVKRKIEEDKEGCAYYHFVLKISEKSMPSDEMNVNKNLEPQYELEGTQMKFDTISELLAFYKKIPINFDVDTIGDEVQSDFDIMSGGDHSLHHPQVAETETKEMRLKLQHLGSEIAHLNDALVKNDAESNLLRKENEDLNAALRQLRSGHDKFGAEYSDKIQKIKAMYKKRLEHAELEHCKDLKMQTQQWESREKSLLKQLEDLQQMKGVSSCEDQKFCTSKKEVAIQKPPSSLDHQATKKKVSKVIPAQPTAKLEGIMEHPSYHGAMTGAKAESKLKEHGGNCYLTRYSTSREQYSLSVARNGEYAHFDLIITSASGDINIYEIDGTEMQSKDIFSLLAYYKDNPLTHTIDGIGDPLLSDPSKTFERQNSEILENLKEVYRRKFIMSADEDTPNDNLSHPSLSNLTLMTYDNIAGRRASISIMAQLDSRWHDLGLVLGQSAEDLVRYKVLTLGDSSKYPCCRRVFSEWLKNADYSKYPATWAGVYDLLRDMECAALATKLKMALRSNGIKI